MDGPYNPLNNESCFPNDNLAPNSNQNILCYPLGTSASNGTSCPNSGDILSQSLDPFGFGWCLNPQYQQYLSNVANIKEFYASIINCEVNYNITLAYGIPLVLILFAVVVYLGLKYNNKF